MWLQPFPNSWNVPLYTPKVVNLRYCDLSRRDHDADMLDKKGVLPPPYQPSRCKRFSCSTTRLLIGMLYHSGSSLCFCALLGIIIIVIGI